MADLVAVCAGWVVAYLGRPDRTFGSPVYSSSISYVKAQGREPLAIADFNGDGIPDLAVTDYTDNLVIVQFGRGDGTFTGAGSYSVASGPTTIVAADFNGDGHPDLAVASSTAGQVEALTNLGNGTFAPGSTLPVNQPATEPVLDLVTADFNGDGRADLAALPNYQGAPVWVWLGQPGGTFGLPSTYSLPSSQGEVMATGDFNHDGRSDLAVAVTDLNASQGHVQVFLGAANGTLTTGSTLSVPGNYGSLRVIDLNNDANLDLVLASPQAGTQYVVALEGDGLGGFSSAVDIGAQFTSDVAPLTWGPNPAQDLALIYGGVAVAINNGDGTFETARTFLLGGASDPYYYAVTADFNGDGFSDTAADDGSSVDVALADGQGGLLAMHSYPVGNIAESITVGDFNGDGIADLAVVTAATSAGTAVAVLLGKGDGTFGSPIVTAGNVSSVLAADFNGDGRMDLLVTANGGIQAWLGRGDGTFDTSTPATQVPNQYGIGPPVVGDLRGDGKLDAVVPLTGSGVPTYGTSVAVLLGDGTGRFGQPTFYTVGAGPDSPVLGDFNGDGHLDLAVGALFGNAVSVLLGDGSGGFSGRTDYPAGSNVSSLAIADINGDGSADLVAGVGNIYGPIEVATLDGRGDGSFAAPSLYQPRAGSETVMLGRFGTQGGPEIASYGPGGTSTRYVGLLANLSAATWKPGISGISPSSGQMQGGGRAAITGFGFQGGTGRCDVSSITFGGTPAPAPISCTDTELVTTVPPGANQGPVSVVVTTNRGGGSSPASYTYNQPTGSTWNLRPGAAQYIASGGGQTFVLGTNAVNGGWGIYRWAGGGWVSFQGGLVDLAVGPDGNPWGVNSGHQIYHWTGSGWQLMPGSGDDVAVGAGGNVYVLGSNSVPGGSGIWSWNGGSWSAFPGGGTSLAVDSAGHPWITNNVNEIWGWNGSGWIHEPGSAHYVTAGADGSVYVLGTNAVGGGWGLWYLSVSGWVSVDGGGTSIALDSADLLWVTNSAQQIYERT